MWHSIGFGLSHLVLPRIDIDALIEHCIHVSRVRVGLLKVLFINLLLVGRHLVEHLLAVEILVCCLREAHVGSIRQGMLRRLSMGRLVRLLIATWARHLSAEYLRLCAEILLLILWEVVDSAVLAVQRAEVLVIVRVVVVVEAEHTFLVLGLSASQSSETALLYDGTDLGGVKVLQLIKVDAREQILLLFGESGQIILT